MLKINLGRHHIFQNKHDKPHTNTSSSAIAETALQGGSALA